MLKRSLLIAALSVSFPTFATDKSPITLLTISSLSAPTPSSQNKFSLHIEFKANTSLAQWALGFYMPGTLDQFTDKSVEINPLINMEICKDNATSCSPLYYAKEKYPYISAGPIQVIMPPPPMPLQLNHTYVIKINSSNQVRPRHYSAMPQSFFLITKDKRVLAIADARPEQYHISEYDHEKIQTTIKQHLKTNWQNSMPFDTHNLADRFQLIPTPTSISLTQQQSFKLIPHSRITIQNDFKNDSNNALLSSYLKQDLDIQLKSTINNAIIIIQKSPIHSPEGYKLTITPHNILIEAQTSTGAFYAIQTLRQLWHQNKLIPSLVIKDQPRFIYRGILLDVTRHYFSVNEIKKLIDVMAAHKLNTLHIHFSDDEGWRLDISENDALKSLISKGSKRGLHSQSVLPPSALIQANLDITNYKDFSPSHTLIQKNYTRANELYSGHYSRKDIATLIRYANARHITIIPEIDLPGHARALIYSLPNIFINKNDKSHYLSIQGYSDNIIPVCLYGKETFQGKKLTQTLNTIIQRFNEMFKDQSTIYHRNEVSLGGDEVPSSAWANDPSCNEQESQTSAQEKSHLFFSNLIKQNHIIISGWQELVQNDNMKTDIHTPQPQTIGHIWVWEKSRDSNGLKGIAHAIKLAELNYPIVLAYADDTYFDLTYTPDKWEPGFQWAGAFLDTHAALHSALNAITTENLISRNHKHRLLGLEAALWSENIANFNHLVYTAFPKMAGLAEAAWASKTTTTNEINKINWQSLVIRLGQGNNGFLNFIHQTNKVKYRGYPHGISLELPENSTYVH